jgi:hypothetical protein
MVDCTLMYEIMEICFLWRRRGCNNLEQSGRVPMDAPGNVGCIIFGEGGCGTVEECP